MIDEGTAVEEPQLGEEDSADERHRGQFLEADLNRELVLFLLHHKSHITNHSPHSIRKLAAHRVPEEKKNTKVKII